MLVLITSNIPCTICGCYIGFMSNRYDVKVKLSRVRVITSEKSSTLQSIVCFFLMSTIPFAVVALQFYYVFTSISGGENLIVLCNSVFLTACLLFVVICEISVIQNYILFCWGQADWWWRTYMYGASMFIWVFLLMTYHLFVNLFVNNTVSLLAYLTIMYCVCMCGAIATGSIAVCASFCFNSMIYSKVRQD